MGVNIVIYNNEKIIDLSADTVTEDKLFKGVTAHNSAGDVITGAYVDDEIHEGVYCWQVFQSDADITPVMTSNETNGYVAFASSEVSTPRQAWCAFDNISGIDQEMNRWHGAANDLPGYIGMIFPNPVAVEYFTVKNASSPHKGIKEFQLQYSLDGEEWKSIGSFTNPADFEVESTYTPTTVPSSARYWRLYITSTHHVSGNSSYCIIDEIKFYTTAAMGFVVSNDENAYPSSGTGENGLYYVAIGKL